MQTRTGLFRMCAGASGNSPFFQKEEMQMASNRIGRINEEIQRELAELLRELKDPRVHKTMVSITHVETTPDLRYAKVYVSMLDKDCVKETLAGLKSSGGYLRRELGRNLQLRYTPELQWQADDSITHGAHILDILSKLDIPEDTEDEATDSQ